MKVSILSTSRSGHNFIKAMIKSWLPDVEFEMLENVLPTHVYQHDTKGTKKLIVIRDFKNFLASSLKALSLTNGTWEVNIARKIEAYKAIKAEAENPKYYKNATVIDYDKFVADEEYRENICDDVGGEYTEKKLNYVPNEGNGSSFDGFELQGKGQTMNTRERHLEILETEWKDIYLTLMKEYEDSQRT